MSALAQLAPPEHQGDAVDRSYIGGGLIAAILGLSPHKSQVDAYFQLIGEAPAERFDPVREKRLKRGKRMEPYIVQMLAEDHGITIVGRNQRYVDPEYPYMRAEIDFEWHDDVDPRVRNGEIKTVAVMPGQVNQWGEEGSDEIPVHIAAQGMFGLGLTGRDLCQYGVLFGMDNLCLYELRFDAFTFADMREAARSFMECNVLPRIPPTPRTLADLARLWPTDRGTKIEATPEIAEMIAKHDELGTVERNAHAEREELKFRIAEFCEDNADIILHDGRKIATFKAQSRAEIDTKLLKAREPEIYKQFSRSTTFRVLRHSKEKTL